MIDVIAQVASMVTALLPIIIGLSRIVLGNASTRTVAGRTQVLAELRESLPAEFRAQLDDELRAHIGATCTAFRRHRTRKVDAANIGMVIVFGLLAGGSVWLGFRIDAIWSITVFGFIGAALALFTAIGASSTFTYAED